MSGDGSVVVGTQQRHALVWDTTHGMRDLGAVLGAQGVNLQGNVLREAVWVSPDGTWVAGNADTPAAVATGWIARIR